VKEGMGIISEKSDNKIAMKHLNSYLKASIMPLSKFAKNFKDSQPNLSTSEHP
jgi:hypothetical protein